ncbi:MAG: AgmX/PglI C-terminal domain-containing protein [Bdellovibrionales bacterium]|nr:AgmX/PglI C-terminal domain-containing protein [Bdellovibrionales bacterium]
MANLFGALPTPGGGKGNSKVPINIQKGPGSPNKTGIRVGGLSSGVGASGGAGGDVVGLGLGTQAGLPNYAQNKDSKAGKQGVAGAVVGRPTFSGVKAEQGIDNDAVMKVVNSHLRDVHRCYERALFKDANIVGRVEYEWEISAQGVVSSVTVKRSEVSNGDFLNSCVVELFKKMKFPVAKNGQTTTASIGFPFGKN